MATITNTTYSTSGLIAAIQRNALLPQNQLTFESPDYIAMLNEEMQTRIVPLLLSVGENFYLKTTTIPLIPTNSISMSIAAPNTPGGNNVGYALPADAIGTKLNAVSFAGVGGIPYVLQQLDRSLVGSPFASFQPGFWLENQTIFLYPAAAFQSGGNLVLEYPSRPLDLCDDTGVLGVVGTPSAVQISGVNTTTGVITVANAALPASFVVSQDVNFLQGVPAFITEAYGTITAVTTNTFTVAAAALTDAYGRQLVNVGDWVANAGYSPFLQLPVECKNLVTQSVIVKLLQALGDEKAPVAEAKYQQMAADVIRILSPRIDNAPKILTTANRGIGAYAQMYRRTMR